MIEDCDRLNMRQKKGDSTTHILSDKGRKNFSEIKKWCGHVLGEKCNCKSTGGIDYGKARD